MTEEPVLRFDTKIAVLLRTNLRPWQELNVTAFLISGLAATLEDIIGEPYEDADGTRYLPMIRQPIAILTGSPGLLAASHQRAVSRGLSMTIYTEELFGTSHDEANRRAVRAVPQRDLNLVGLGLHGPRGLVDKALRGAQLHT